MTDEELRAAAEADPDNPPLTEDELTRLERVPAARAIRRKLGMTQEEFARTYHLSLSVLRDWEQQRCQPDQAARTLLRVIERSPEAVRRALRRT
jgi:putative transcriptional regulator